MPKVHVIFGTGAPIARQTIVASFPSNTVTFFGDCSIIGVDAIFCLFDFPEKEKKIVCSKISFNCFISNGKLTFSVQSIGYIYNNKANTINHHFTEKKSN